MSVRFASSKFAKSLSALATAATMAFASFAAHGALLPRDIDGDGIIDAYYDTALNISWLADWNSIGHPVTWDEAVSWAASLNVHGISGWRLPGITDSANPGCDFSAAGGTDCGYNVATSGSELARMWYVTLGNLAFCAAGNPNCNLQGPGQPGWGLSNSGPFRNMQSSDYWSGTQYAPDTSSAWNFSTHDGSQGSDPKTALFNAVAVHSGDVAPVALAYKAIDLNPPGFDFSEAHAVSAGQQVGSGSGASTSHSFHALVWTAGPASAVDLHPPGFDQSVATGAAGNQQVGSAFDGNLNHAMLWTGSAASGVDLNPAGFPEASATGADVGQQVGVGFGSSSSHALLWTGSAASAVDLHPSGFANSQARGVGGGQQVGDGQALIDGQGHALLWAGSAASVVDLHPSGFSSTQADAVADGLQVGGGRTGFNSHALLWSGSAASVVDLHPAGFQDSWAYGVAGGQQVGAANDGHVGHAMLWSGSAASALDLHPFLAAGFVDSAATGVDDAGNIVGYAGSHAVLWVPALPYSLAITKQGAPNPVLVGAQLTYTITMTNNRPGAASGVSVADVLPAGVTLVSASADQGSCAGTSTVTCNLGSLPGGDSTTVTIVVTPTLTGDIANSATVSADGFVNNAATERTTINPSADLSITKTDLPDPVSVGRNLTYTIKVTNAGPSPATDVTMQDVLPGGANFVSATPTQGSCNGSATVSCNLGSLAKGASAKVTIVVVPTQAGPISNTATAAANESDPNAANNSATQNTTVNAVPLPDLTGSWLSAAQKCKSKRGKTTCTINGSISVANQGNAAAGACIVRFYLSSDAILSTDDVSFGQANVPNMLTGQRTTLKVKPALPAGTNASGKFVIAVIDGNNVLTESNKSNNVLATARFP